MDKHYIEFINKKIQGYSHELQYLLAQCALGYIENVLNTSTLSDDLKSLVIINSFINLALNNLSFEVNRLKKTEGQNDMICHFLDIINELREKLINLFAQIDKDRNEH